MTPHDIQTIYAHYFWANQKILACTARVTHTQFVAPTTHSYGTLRGILTHLLDVDIGWCHLFQHGTTDSFDTLQENSFATFAALQKRWNEQESALRKYLANLDESNLTLSVRYADAEGFKGEWPLWQCLYHLANHATQHRSEAAAILTDSGSSPGEMDFLAFRNENP